MRDKIRITPIIGLLAGLVAMVALACAGDSATPTSPATSTSPAPTATSPAPTATVPAGSTATAVPAATATAMPAATESLEGLTQMERFLRSPGYQPEWGDPVTGGTMRVRGPRNPTNFTPGFGVTTTSGFFNLLPFNGLMSFDPWVGMNRIIPELAKSWVMSSDGLELTLQLEEGVIYHDNPNVPAEFNGGAIANDEITCEDVQASVEWFVRPPSGESRNMTRGRQTMEHMNPSLCPDGADGYTVVFPFERALGKTMNALAAGHLRILDKDYIEWVKTMSPDAMRASTGDNFAKMAGTGSFLPVDFQPEIMGKFTRNTNYWRTGLPLVDKWESFVIKDYTTAFTALATGQIHLFGRGSWALLPGQVAQAERDFADKITVHPVLHAFADGIQFYPKPGSFMDDRRVRQAINLAVDRDEYLILNEAGSQPGRILMALLFPKSPWSFTEDELRQMPGLRAPKDADIAEANRLLDEVFGAGERPTVECATTAVADQTQICLFLGDQLKKNVNMDVTFSFSEQAVQSQKGETCSLQITAGSSGGSTRIGDPDDWFFASLHRRTATTPGSVCRLGFLADAEPELFPEVETEIDAQSIEIDPIVRKRLVQDLESKIFLELIPKIGFGWNFSFPAAGNSVKGYFQAPLMSYISEVALWERLWLVD